MLDGLLKMRQLGFFLVVCFLIGPASAQSLNSQLQSAVDQQQWGLALYFVDQMMLEASPEQQQYLQQYRQKLLIRVNETGGFNPSVQTTPKVPSVLESSIAAQIRLNHVSSEVSSITQEFDESGSRRIDGREVEYSDYTIYPAGYQLNVNLQSPTSGSDQTIPVYFLLMRGDQQVYQSTQYLRIRDTGGHNLQIPFTVSEVARISGGSGKVTLLVEPEGGNPQRREVYFNPIPGQSMGSWRRYSNGETACRGRRGGLDSQCRLIR